MLKRFFLLFLLLIGCGYKPSTTYTKKILKDNIKIDFQISPKNPKETIYLKDALIDLDFSFFGLSVAKLGASVPLPQELGGEANDKRNGAFYFSLSRLF